LTFNNYASKNQELHCNTGPLLPLFMTIHLMIPLLVWDTKNVQTIITLNWDWHTHARTHTKRHAHVHAHIHTSIHTYLYTYITRNHHLYKYTTIGLIYFFVWDGIFFKMFLLLPHKHTLFGSTRTGMV